MHKYIFDLDNTLVFTDDLNNEAYNYALISYNKKPIHDVKRITREVVFSRYVLTEDEKNSLVALKQKYFINNIDKIQKNEDLLEFLISKSSADCILWTSAEDCRVEAILSYLNLHNAFSLIIKSKKLDIEKDLDIICKHFNCSKSQLKIYDYDTDILNELKLLGIRIA